MPKDTGETLGQRLKESKSPDPILSMGLPSLWPSIWHVAASLLGLRIFPASMLGLSRKTGR